MVTCSHVKVFSARLLSYWQPLLFNVKKHCMLFWSSRRQHPLPQNINRSFLSQIHPTSLTQFCLCDLIYPSNITSMCHFGIKHSSESVPFAPFHIFPLPPWGIQGNFPHLGPFWIRSRRYWHPQNPHNTSQEIMMSTILKKMPPRLFQYIFFSFSCLYFVNKTKADSMRWVEPFL